MASAVFELKVHSQARNIFFFYVLLPYRVPLLAYLFSRAGDLANQIPCSSVRTPLLAKLLLFVALLADLHSLAVSTVLFAYLSPGWKMAPYIEDVDSQQSSYFIIKCFCNILRIRWESSRSRTKERSLLMMDKLVHYYVQSHIQINEYRDCVVLPSASKTHGRHISTCIKILDMTVLKLSALSQIKVVKPLLQERTRKKVQVLSGCGQDELLKIMDYDSLPHFCRKQGSGSSKHLSEACKNCFSYDHPFHQQLYDYIKKQASLLEPAAPLTQRSFHVNLPETEGSVEEVDQTIESEVHKLEISESSYGSASSED